MKTLKVAVAIAAPSFGPGTAGAQEIFNAAKGSDLAKAKAIVETSASVALVRKGGSLLLALDGEKRQNRNPDRVRAPTRWSRAPASWRP